MKAYLENIDIFSYRINLNYKKKDVYHSFFGIWLSFILYLLMIFFCYFFSYDFFSGTSPKVIYQETEFAENISFPLNSFISNLEYYYSFSAYKPLYEFSLNNTQASEIDRQSQYQYYNNSNKTFNLVVNSTYNFFTPVLVFYPTKQDDKTFEIYTFIDSFRIESYETAFNQYNAEFFKSFGGLNATKCYFYYFRNLKKDKILVNKTSVRMSDSQNYYEKFESFVDINSIKLNITADSLITLGFDISRLFYHENNKINKIHLSLFSFEYSYLDYIINVNKQKYEMFRNFSNVFSNNFILETGDLKNTKIHNKMLRMDFGFIKSIEDSGIFFYEPKIDFSVKKNYDSLISFDEGIDNGLISVSEISFNKIMKQYHRTYKKLQNVFADLGGIFSSLVLIGNILISQLNKKKFDYDLINNLFRIENTHSDHKNNTYIMKVNSETSKLSIDKNYTINFGYNNKNFNSESCSSRNLIYNKNIIEDFYNNNDNISIGMNNKRNNNYIKKVANTDSISSRMIDSNLLLKSVIDNLGKNRYNDCKENNIGKIASVELKDFSMLRKQPCSNLYSNIIKQKLKRKSQKNNPIPNQIKKAPDKEKNVKRTLKNNFEEYFHTTNNSSKLKQKVFSFLKDHYEPNKKVNNLIKFSKSEFIKTYLCCNKLKSKSLIDREILFEKATNIIHGYLDVSNFASLYEDFEKLKKIIFNEYQIVCFDFLLGRDITEIFKESYESKVYATVKYFKNKIKQRKVNLYDKKLNNLMYEKFKDLLIN